MKSDSRDFGSCFYVDSQRRNHLDPTIKPPSTLLKDHFCIAKGLQSEGK